MQDDLSDVRLDGVQLVSDDPADWVIPAVLRRDQKPIQFWEDLIRWDEALQDFDMDKLLQLTAMADWVAVTNTNTRQDQARLWHTLTAMAAEGLTTEQIGKVCFMSRRDVVKAMLMSHVMSEEDVQIRFFAESLLRQGRTFKEVERRTGMTKREVQTWAKNLGIPSPEDFVDAAGRKHLPKEIRSCAEQMIVQGHQPKEIVHAIEARWPQHAGRLKPATVSQWKHRLTKGS